MTPNTLTEPSKILVVDDNPKNIQVIGNVLRNAGYQVGFASSGRQAIDLLIEPGGFELILMDIYMPEMDGFETCEKIRQARKINDIPIIVLTAILENENIVKAFDAGAQDYITKPFNSRELLSRVATQLDLKRHRDQLQLMNAKLESLVKERTQALIDTNVELENANLELQLLDEAKADFLRIISHEINTPLNGILGFIGLLKERVKSPELITLLLNLESSASRLERFSMVSLQITELRTKGNINKTAINLPQALITVLTKHQRVSLAKHIVIVAPKTNENALILGDGPLLDICIYNIIDNAITHCPIGGEISIDVVPMDNRIKCIISDNGKGFSKEALKNKFRAFSPGQQRVDKNKGLGLALCKLIMDAHHGTIDIYNKHQGGAAVELSFQAIDEAHVAHAHTA